MPKPLVDLVDRALAFERDDRWSDAREMQAAVRTVHAMLGPEAERPAEEERSLGTPASNAPVTLLTPHPMVSSAFRGIYLPWYRRKWLVAFVGLAAVFAAWMLVAVARRTPLAAPPPAVLAAPTPLEPLPTAEVQVPVLTTPEPPETAATENARPRETAPPPVIRPKNEKTRPAKPASKQAAPTAAPASTQPPSVAPSVETQLPSSADPLDRRR
jgi:hypothetical protein